MDGVAERDGGGALREDIVEVVGYWYGVKVMKIELLSGVKVRFGYGVRDGLVVLLGWCGEL